MAVSDPAEPLAAAIAVLRGADPVMARLIDRVGADSLGDPRRGRPPDHYGSLIRSIVGQQVSTQSAAAIYGRLLERYGGRTPTPEQVLAEDPESLRAAVGLSHAKLAYLRSLAEHIVDGSLELSRLDQLTDEEIMAELVGVRGIGPWTAQTFLMFHLQRPDVLPVGDLGIRRALMIEYGLGELPGPAETERLAAPWRPHRTLACRFLWRSLHATPI
ncbi:MAG TPA: DNA-3-methyladenine glycosylase [Solirubrobacteraceae bacterium]